MAWKFLPPNINLPTIGPATNTKTESICADRDAFHNQPKNITHVLKSYVPFKQGFIDYKERKNIFGWTVYRRNLESGMVVEAFDGKRIVYEVGCNSVIYVLISPNPQNPDHHRFFIQPTNAFIFDITERLMASKVVTATAPMVKIVKYEMYFLLGVFASSGLAAWLAFTGSDLIYTSAVVKHKMDAARDMTTSMTKELENINSYAPTLHKKLVEFLDYEKKIKWAELGKQLPETIVKSDKVQGILAGTLYGQFAISPNIFTGWTILTTILLQAGASTFTNAPKAYGELIDKRYQPIIQDILSVNLNDPEGVKVASAKLVSIMKESGVKISVVEAGMLISEVKQHPKELQQSLENINKAFDKFIRAMKD